MFKNKRKTIPEVNVQKFFRGQSGIDTRRTPDGPCMQPSGLILGDRECLSRERRDVGDSALSNAAAGVSRERAGQGEELNYYGCAE